MNTTTASRSFLIAASAVGLVAALLSGACAPSKPLPTSADSSTESAVTPEVVLSRMRQAYRSAKSYSDSGVLIERGVSRARGTVTEIAYSRTSLLFERPNRYALTFEYGVGGANQAQYRVVSNGERVRCQASELPEQVHEALAPQVLTTENLVPEPELRRTLFEVSIENLFPQLAMIVTPNSDQPIFPRATRMELLEEKSIATVHCYRLALTEPEGTRVLWIDKEKWLLRRMELPIDGQRQQMDPTRQYKSFSVDLDFENVVINGEFDESAIDLEVPEGARLVRRFVPPPAQGPPPGLGRPVKPFEFTDANGAAVSNADLQGKVAVLEFWASDCAPCKQHTPVLEAAYQELKGDDQVAFYGVSTDPKGLSTGTVKKTLESWGATFPLLRDADKQAFYELEVQGTPTLMMLSPDGRLQAFYIGMLENAEDLVRKVRQVKSGEDLAQEAQSDHKNHLEKYQAVFAAATLEGSLIDEEFHSASIARRKLPESLDIDKVWQSDSKVLKEPGDVTVMRSPEREPIEILTIDSGDEIVRLRLDGTVIARVKLPSKLVDGFLRTASGDDGKPWTVASGRGSQQVHLFDERWKPYLSFPDEQHSGIGDAQLIDFDGKGAPSVVVGYRGGLGVHVGTLDGQRGWVNRHLDYVLQISRGPKEEDGSQPVWCTSTRGTIFEISADGKMQREFPVVGHTMVSLESSPTNTRKTFYGVSQIHPGKHVLVAFDGEGDVTWDYELPEGDYVTCPPAVERIKLNRDGETLVVAGPDGSVHFVSLQGKALDRFDYGEPIARLAAVTSDDGTFLWVSAGKHLTAWRISAKVAP